MKEGDALALPFADGEFDRIVAAEVLEHIPADIQAIDELARVLRPGGTIALTVPAVAARGDLLAAVGGLPQHPRRPHPDLHRQGAGRPRRRTPAWPTRAATTPTACTRRTGGSSARSASRTTTTRSCAATTGCWCGTSCKRPRTTRWAEQVLNPLIGKSLVLYFASPMRPESAAPAGDPDRRRRWPRRLRRSRPCRSRVEPSRGPRGSTPTCGTTSRARWRCWWAARSTPPSGPSPGRASMQRADGSWPLKIVAGRGRGRERRDQRVGVPRGRPVAPLADPA